MTAARKKLSGSLLLLFFIWPEPLAQADPFRPFRPGDVLRMTFDLRWCPPPSFPVPLDAFDLFAFHPGVQQIEPVSSYTVRLFDRGQLLGTYVGNASLAVDIGYPPIAAAFTAPTSTFTRGNPTVIDFSSFQDGTIEGAVELTIQSGRLNVYRVTDEFGIAQTYGDRHIAAQATFGATSVANTAVPEPSSLLLLLTGVAGMAAQLRARAGGASATGTAHAGSTRRQSPQRV